MEVSIFMLIKVVFITITDAIIYTIFGIDNNRSFDFLDEALYHANNFADFENFPLKLNP